MKNIFHEISTKKNKDYVFNISSLDSMNENCMRESVAMNNNKFEILWVVNGTGRINIDLQQFYFDDNHVFFVKPGQVYVCHPNNNMEGYIISFTESFLNMGDPEFDSGYHSNLFQLFSNGRVILLNDDEAEDMKDAVARMIKEFNGNSLFHAEIVKRYLKIFLLYLTRQFEGSLYAVKQSRNTEMLQKFLTLLDKNFKTKKMVADYADSLCVTPNYLNEIIKKMTGHSAGYHIRQRIVLEAKRRAAYSDSCMKEIAYHLGFCDIAHFSKFFKNTAGLNFTDFRKERFMFSTTPAA